jgi:response regulator RpfG family c-di-GMP phosphodiesterase
MERKISTLLLDNDLDARMRLRHALSLNSDFGKDIQTTSCEEALAALNRENDSVDLVFIANTNLEFNDIQSFIEQARALSGAHDAAFVLVFSTYGGKDELISQVYELGADSYIFEPYSADDLCRMANVAIRVGPRRLIDREMLSIEPLVREMVRLINLVHRLTLMNCCVDKTMERLRMLGARLASFQDESKEAYFEYIEEVLPFESAPDQSRDEMKGTEVKSTRLKRRLEAALLSAAEKRREREEEIKRKLPPVRCNQDSGS